MLSWLGHVLAIACGMTLGTIGSIVVMLVALGMLLERPPGLGGR